MNAFLPGGGQALRENYPLAATQFVLEGTTFGYGYSLSKLSPMTIDGVPEDLPQALASTFTTVKRVCTRVGARLVCTNRSSTSIGGVNQTPQDFSKPIYADILQEFGLKYHMVNVFNAYRTTAAEQGVTERIDQRDTGDMFKDPFKLENILNPWVGIPLAIVAAATVYDYGAQVRTGLVPIQVMNTRSNGLYAFNYMAWQPFGSGVPEEMFYRGFLQNEFYGWVNSPFFSVGLSTLAFTFSHAPTGWTGAAISGAYLGFLMEKFGGNLAPGITLHFWSVVFLGIETYFLNKKAQGAAPPPGFQLQVAI